MLVPAGPSLLDAASWVGASCRAELALHELLTATLGADAGVDRSAALWEVRAHRAEVAELWHRRLPELREMPRERFVAGEGPNGSPEPADLATIVAGLDDLLDRYRAHLPVAVGPADGPVADVLAHAIGRAEQDRRTVADLR